MCDPRDYNQERRDESETSKFISEKIQQNMKMPQEKFTKPMCASHEIGYVIYEIHGMVIQLILLFLISDGCMIVHWRMAEIES